MPAPTYAGGASPKWFRSSTGDRSGHSLTDGKASKRALPRASSVLPETIEALGIHPRIACGVR
jgi:hypothetical protein